MLHDYPFDSDSEAIDNIEKFDIPYVGGIIKLTKGKEYPPQVLNAVDYLCDNWDYGVEWI